MNRVARKGLVTAMVAGGVLASAGYAQADSAAEGAGAGSPGVLSGNTVQVPVDVPANVCGNTVNVVGLLNPAMGNRCVNASAAAAPSRPRGSMPVGGSMASSGARPARHTGDSAVESGGPRRESPREEGGTHARGSDTRTSNAQSSGTQTSDTQTSDTQSSADHARATGADTRTSGGGARAVGGSSDSPGVVSGNMLGLPIHLPVNLSGNSANVVGIGNPAFGNTSVNGETPQPPVRILPAPPEHQPIPAPPNNLATAPVADAIAPAPVLAHTGSAGLGWTTAGSAGLLLGGAVLYRRFRPGRG
jgi:hypothetical protein